MGETQQPCAFRSVRVDVNSVLVLGFAPAS